MEAKYEISSFNSFNVITNAGVDNRQTNRQTEKQANKQTNRQDKITICPDIGRGGGDKYNKERNKTNGGS